MPNALAAYMWPASCNAIDTAMPSANSTTPSTNNIAADLLAGGWYGATGRTGGLLPR